LVGPARDGERRRPPAATRRESEITVLGWLLLLGGIAGLVWVLRARARAVEAAGRTGAPPAPTTGQYAGVLAGLILGIWLVATGSGATARLAQSHAWDFQSDPQWLINNAGAIQWDQQAGVLKASLASGSGAYAVAPVDWNADAFRAEFDLTIESLNTPLSVVGVGLFDGSISNIDDRDHVGGSSIQASFGNDIRLVVSDTNLLSRRDSMSDRDGEPKPVQLQPGKTYHAVLGYNRRIDTATLEVSEQGSSSPLVQLKVEELRDFTPNVAYFGVSIKGYNKNKDADPKPTATATLDNVRFFQP
jgi:hypothetical protein